MGNLDPKVVRTVRLLALSVAVTIALGFPIWYFAISYPHQTGILEIEARVHAQRVARLVNADPETWQFQGAKLEEVLSQGPQSQAGEIRRIFNAKNQLVVEVRKGGISSPLIARSAEVADSGLRVGRVEICRSLWPLLLQTALVALAGLLLGLAVFFALRLLPLRVLTRVMGENARLLDETRKAMEDSQSINEITTIVLRSADLKAVLQSVLEKTVSIFSFDVGCVLLVEASSGRIEIVAHYGYRTGGEVVAETKIGAHGRHRIRNLEERRLLVIEDLQGQERMQTLRAEGVRSAILVPILTEESVVGVIQVGSRTAKKFEQRELSLLESIGGQIGIAVQKAMLYEETRQRAEEQEAINAVAFATGRSLNVQDLLDLALAKVLEVTGWERGSIRLRDPESGVITLVAQRGFPVTYVHTHLHTPGSGEKSDQVFASGQSLVMSDAEAGLLKEEMIREGIGSLAWIPMKLGGRVVGVLSVFATREVTLGEREIKLLEAIGSVIASAVENARLFEATQQSLSRMQALQDIGQAINSRLDLRATVDVLLQKIDLFFPYPIAGAVRLPNQETGEVQAFACRNINEEEWRANEIRSPRGRAKRIMETGAPLIIRNVEKDETTHNPEFFARNGLVSYVGVPLEVEGSVVGILSLYTREERDFGEEDLEFLKMLAGQAAVAINNARLYEQVKSQAAELERSDKVKSEFLSVVSHELRTPLTAILGYTEMLLGGAFDAVSPQQEKALNRVLLRAKDLLRSINNILELTRIEAHAVRIEKQTMRIGDFFGEIKSTYAEPLQKDVELRWGCPNEILPLRIDAGKLRQVVQNLIDNAIKFTAKGGIMVSARVVAAERGAVDTRVESGFDGKAHLELQVRDTGIGIDQDQLPFIFEMFTQVGGSDAGKGGGAGVGLFIVKKFTEMMGGKVDVMSEPGKGSTFTVRVPIES